MALYIGNKKVAPIVFKYKDIEAFKGILEGTATDIVLPDSITKIAAGTFGRTGTNRYPSNLTSIKGNGVLEIGNYGVNNSNYLNTLKTIEFPNVKKLGNYALSTSSSSGNFYCSVEKIILGELEEIGQYALQRLFVTKDGITQEIQMSFNNCVIDERAFDYYKLPAFDGTGVKSLAKAVFTNIQIKNLKCWLPSTIEAIYTTSTSSSNCLFSTSGANHTITIYTDIPDAESVPTTWGTGWNACNGGSVTMVYGATYEDFLNA